MILYAVFGVENHAGRTLLGIYYSNYLAECRQESVNEKIHGYDKIIVQQINVNEDIDDL